MIIITIVGLVSGSLGILLTNPVNPVSEIAPLLDSVNIVGMTFVTSLFSFSTAGLLFSSQSSRSYLLKRIEQVGAKRAYLIRSLHTFIITSVFTLFITIVAFLKPVIYGINIHISYFASLPAVLGASLIVSICLASIAVALASITDDSRLCTILGSASTIVIATVAGWSANYYSWDYSITRNLALLSPHNIVRALAVQLSGFQFESTNDMVRYVGFIVSIEGLTIALLILISISIVLFFAGQKALVKNSTRWPVIKGMITVDEKWDSTVSSEKLQVINRIRRGLKIQRGLTTMVVVVLLFSLFTSGSMYNTYIVNSATTIHYTTPGFSENIPVGSWLIYDVDANPPFPGLFYKLQFGIDIVTLGNTSGTVSIFIGIIEMNSTEFNSLEESSRLELVHDWLNQSLSSGFGIGTFFEDYLGSFVCVLKIISDTAPAEMSYIEGTLRITQEAY